MASCARGQPPRGTMGAPARPGGPAVRGGSRRAGPPRPAPRAYCFDVVMASRGTFILSCQFNIVYHHLSYYMTTYFCLRLIASGGAPPMNV